MQHICEKVLNRCLEGHPEEDIACADKPDLPPPAFLPTLLFSKGQRDLAMLFDIDGKAGDGAVEEQKAERGQ